MTSKQFYELDEMGQAETIRQGKHIADRQDMEHNILLYKIDSLYVEVYYRKENNVITKLKTVSSSELLDIYGIKNTEKKERTLKEISKEMQQKRIAALNDLNKHDKSN